MRNFKLNLTKWHFYLLGLVLLNFIAELIIGYSINQNLTFYLKVILYLTGIFLFFKTLKPFNLKTAYFSFYTISATLTGLFLLFGGIFLAALSSILLYPVYPKQIAYKTETIKVYHRFQGFMGRCCSYEVVESKLYLFENHLGYINIERSINADKDKLYLDNNKVIYKHEIDNYEFNKQTTKMPDTTEILSFE